MRRVGVLIGTFLLPVAALARMWPVAPDGSTDVPSIDAAMNVASSGDTVAVAAGTHMTTNVELKEGVLLLGGWNPSFSSRNPGTSVLQTTGAHVLQATRGQTPATLVDGFAITGARESAILCDGASPTLTNNELHGNTARDGGAIRCTNGASPLIESSHIHNNTADYGGGIRAHFGTDTSPRIRHNLIEFNTARVNGLGGGIAVNDGNALVEHNVISNNTARDSGGGVFVWRSATPSVATIRHNLIVNNSSGGAGAGIFISEGEAVIENNTIWGNSSDWGSGIFINRNPPAFVAGTMVQRNIIGGGDNGEAIACWTGTSIAVLDCNCIFGAAEGPYYGCQAAPTDLFVDPLFCDAAQPDLGLRSGSPCLSSNNPCGALIGSLTLMCGPTSIYAESWGRVKSRYRTGQAR